MTFALRRVVDRVHVKYEGSFHVLDCGHRVAYDKTNRHVERRACPHCPRVEAGDPTAHSAVQRPPLRKVRFGSTDNKDGDFQVLECGHTIFGTSSARSRRCRQCLDEGRT